MLKHIYNRNIYVGIIFRSTSYRYIILVYIISFDVDLIFFKDKFNTIVISVLLNFYNLILY